MERNKQLVFLLLSLLLAAVAGCGNNAGGGATSTLAASEACINCHANATSPGTGANIVAEWKASAHNTEAAANTTGSGSGCRDCHEPAPGHPNSCGVCHGGVTPGALPSQDVVINPDQNQICFNCHDLAHPNDVMLQKAPQHFGNMTASSTNTKYRASYVSSQYVGNCRKCHNPHDPSTRIAINREWASSGHGDLTGNPRTAYDFKTRGTYQPVNTTVDTFCVRCHTTTGYVNYVTSGFTDQRPFGGYSVVKYPSISPDKTKEATGCNACHDDGRGYAYGFKVRTVAATRTYYNYSSVKTSPTVKLIDNPVYFPDVGPSNVCIPCHVGRGIGQMIKDANARLLNFSGVSRIPNAHAYPAGAILFKKAGYEFAGRGYDNLQNFAHDKIGVADFMGTGTSGPCVTCHMTPNRHSFKAVLLNNSLTTLTGTILSIESPICANCHNGNLMQEWTPTTLQDRKAGYNAAYEALKELTKEKGLSVSGYNNWLKPYGPGTGPDTMGASHNGNLLSVDPGGYAHNSKYVKRLIYDSIDWLYNGVLDNDVEAAINSLTFTNTKNPVTGVNYTASEIVAVKAAAISYLVGGRP